MATTLVALLLGGTPTAAQAQPSIAAPPGGATTIAASAEPGAADLLSGMSATTTAAKPLVLQRVAIANSPLYYLKPLHAPKKCLTVHKARKTNNTEIRLYTCLRRANQKFRSIMASSEVGNVIRAQHSKKCLTVHRASKANGARITQYSCHWQSNQIWVGSDGGFFRVKHSNKCLNVKGASKKNNAKVVQYKCHRDYKNGRFNAPFA